MFTASVMRWILCRHTPVKWENQATGYQFCMMVFSGDAAMGTRTRKFSVLSIQPSGDAEVLNLIGTSSTKNEWRIVAEAPASSVGKASRNGSRSDSGPGRYAFIRHEFQEHHGG